MLLGLTDQEISILSLENSAFLSPSHKFLTLRQNGQNLGWQHHTLLINHNHLTFGVDHPISGLPGAEAIMNLTQFAVIITTFTLEKDMDGRRDRHQTVALCFTL